MTNEEKKRLEETAMNDQFSRMHEGLGELKKLLGDGCMFAGTVDDYMDDICGKIEEKNTKAEGETNA